MERPKLDDDEQSGYDRPMKTKTDNAGDLEETTPARADRRRGLRTSLLLAMAVVAIVLGVQAFHLIPDSLNPFAEKTKDRSGPVLLQSIRNLSRYEAASGNFQVIVDLEKDAKFLPGAIRGERTLFVGNGSVDAYVDFSKIGSGAVTVDKNRTTATIRLPRAQLEPTNLNPSRSYVFASRRGLTNRIGDFFDDTPGDQQQLNVLAAQKIQTAATESGLRDRADQNTKLMLENMLKALGFKTVSVTITGQQ
jgi:hypothetical protein